MMLSVNRHSPAAVLFLALAHPRDACTRGQCYVGGWNARRITYNSRAASSTAGASTVTASLPVLPTDEAIVSQFEVVQPGDIRLLHAAGQQGLLRPLRAVARSRYS